MGGRSRKVATKLELLGGFAVKRGRDIALPQPARRVLAYLALHRKPPMRAHLAFALWPDANEQRAIGSLRMALWALTHEVPKIVTIANDEVVLDPGTEVDVAWFSAQAGEDLADGARAEHLIQGFCEPLLPGWYDDWLTQPRESWDDARIHALEAIARSRIRAEDWRLAMAAARAAVAVDQLRETARRLLIEAYTAEGNLAQARRELRDFSKLLMAELGVWPSAELEALVAMRDSQPFTSRDPVAKEAAITSGGPQNEDDPNASILG